MSRRSPLGLRRPCSWLQHDIAAAGGRSCCSRSPPVWCAGEQKTAQHRCRLTRAAAARCLEHQTQLTCYYITLTTLQWNLARAAGIWRAARAALYRVLLLGPLAHAPRQRSATAGRKPMPSLIGNIAEQL